MMPCGDHTQLCSGNLRPVEGSVRTTYFPPTTSLSHSTLEKLIRTSELSPIARSPQSRRLASGIAISADQPLSVSPGRFIVPDTCTAERSPCVSHPSTAFPPLR